MKYVAELMERGRTLLGDKPIAVRSGYRTPEVNDAVGGVAMSAHCFGLACDFGCGQCDTAAEVALVILESDIEYHQLGIPPTGSRVWMGSYRFGEGGNEAAAGRANEALAASSV
jgi:Peptidase M15